MSMNKFRLHRVNVNQRNEILEISMWETEDKKYKKLKKAQWITLKDYMPWFCSNKSLYEMSVSSFATYIQ